MRPIAVARLAPVPVVAFATWKMCHLPSEQSVAAVEVAYVSQSEKYASADGTAARTSAAARAVRAIPEAEIGRNRDRQQDADDHDDNEELDQREAFLTLEPLPQLGHAILLQVVDEHFRVIAHGQRVFAPCLGYLSPPLV